MLQDRMAVRLACCRIQMLSGKIEQYGGNDNG